MRKDSLIKMDQPDSKHVKEQGETFQEALVYLSLAKAYTLNKEFQPAIYNYEKALEIANEHEYKLQETDALLGLGRAYRCNNQFQMAIDHHKKALEIARKIKHIEAEKVSLLALGESYKLNKQFQNAIQCIKESLQIGKRPGDHGTTAENRMKSLSKVIDLNTHEDGNKNLRTFDTSNAVQQQNTQHKNVDNVDIDIENKIIGEETKITAEQLLIDTGTSDGVEMQGIQHECIDNGDHIGIENESISDETRVSVEQLSVLGSSHRKEGASKKRKLENVAVIQEQVPLAGSNKKKKSENVVVIQEQVPVAGVNEERISGNAAVIQEREPLPGANEERNLENAVVIQERKTVAKSPESWAWEEKSIIHRDKFLKLHEYGRDRPQQIQEVNDVRFCCSRVFCIGMGSDGTRVYVGLSKDGYERAVKRLPKDSDYSINLAKQEKKILNEPNALKSSHVIKYRFLDDKGDDEWLFLIMDLCEENLKEFIERSSSDGWSKIARKIIQQVLKGLADIHRNPKRILHRDLKPCNILRDVEGNWLLADFGVSRIVTQDVSTYRSGMRGTHNWIAVESYSLNSSTSNDGNVRYKKASDIQVAGMVAFYTVTRGQHPFGEKPDLERNLVDGKAVGLVELEDLAAKDLISWMLSHDPKDRPSAEEALKHPYFQPAEQQFGMLSEMGNQREIKVGDVNSVVVQKLDKLPNIWSDQMNPKVRQYLCTDFVTRKQYSYGSSWSECLRLIRNVDQHWYDPPRPLPQPEEFYLVGDPQEYFLNLFPNLPVEVHRIVRSCDWKERPKLKEYFIANMKDKC